MKKEEDNELLGLDRYVFSTSRKAFFMVYLLVLCILIFLVVVWLRGVSTPPYFYWIALITCFILIKITEFYRYRKNCEVDKTAVIVNIGFFDVLSKKIYYNAISEVIVRQNFLQKVLDIGDIKVIPHSNEKTVINLTDSPSPKKIAGLIEYRMTNAKRAKSS